MAHPSATHEDQQHVQAHRPVRTLAAALDMSPHDLAHEVPTCWWRHAALADELRAPWYYHQAVTAPLVHVVFPASAPTWPSEEPASPTWWIRSGHAGWT